MWEFHIGGYQVCEKWLKDRGPKKGKPGRTLSEDDICHYQRIVAALKEIICQWPRSTKQSNTTAVGRCGAACQMPSTLEKTTMRSDNPEQEALWGRDEIHPATTEAHLVAEACLLHFAYEYVSGCSKRMAMAPLPRWMDLHSFACLMLCEEHRDKLSPNAAVALANSRSRAAESGGIEWIDVLPWDLAVEVLGVGTYDTNADLEGLVANLTHHNSGIRRFMFDLAWILRRRLTLDAAPGLLKNVADTLGDWWLSLGLCSFLFETDDEFWAYADGYVFEDDRFESQYRDRLKLVRDAGMGMCRCDLYQLDSCIRKLIGDYALRLRRSV